MLRIDERLREKMSKLATYIRMGLKGRDQSLPGDSKRCTGGGVGTDCRDLESGAFDRVCGLMIDG